MIKMINYWLDKINKKIIEKINKMLEDCTNEKEKEEKWEPDL